jgi:hypothetical protein
MEKMKRISLIPLTGGQLAAIGSIAVESACLENLVETLIRDMTKVPDEVLREMLSGAMLAKKLKIFKEVVSLKTKSKSKKQEFAKTIDRLEHLNSQRTIAVHGQWKSLQKFTSFADFANGLQLEMGNAEATLPPRREKKQSPRLQAKNLQQIADEIGECSDKLFLLALDDWIRPAAVRALRSDIKVRSEKK